MQHGFCGVKDGHAVSNVRSLQQNLLEPKATGHAGYVVCFEYTTAQQKKVRSASDCFNYYSIVDANACDAGESQQSGRRAETNNDITRDKNRQR